jgi:ABC-2 type transport system ATP-binding protein
VAQDTPLYRDFTADDLFAMGRRLNERWDDGLAQARLARLAIPNDRPVGSLSGGQRAQVALALVLAKRPDLLILDEPVASLDPLARREFLQLLMSSVAEQGLTVVLSSHLLGDLERLCDHLIVLSASRVQVLGPVDELLAEHRLLVGGRGAPEPTDATVVRRSDTERQTTLLVRTSGPIVDPRWSAHPVTLEDMVLAYLQDPAAGALPGPRPLEASG